MSKHRSRRRRGAPTAFGNRSLRRIAQATSLLLLGACGKDPTVIISDDYGLQLTPLLTDAPDPFTADAELSLIIDDGGTPLIEELGTSADQTWTLPEFPPLASARIDLLVTDPGAQLSPIDYDDIRASGSVGPITLAEGTLDVPVLLTPYGRLGGVGQLTGGQISFGAATAMTSTGDVFIFGGATRVLGSLPADESARHILRLSRADTDLDFDRVGDIPELGGTDAPRVGATATVVMHNGEEQILVVGGRARWTPATQARSRAFLWNPSTTSSTWDGVSPGERSEHVAIPRADGRVFVLGGYDGSGRANFLSFDIWQPGTSPTFTAGPALEERIGSVGFGWADLGDDGIILCGGGRTLPGESALTASEQCQRLRNDGQDGILFNLAEGLSVDEPQRQFLAMAPTLNGKVLVTGGVAQPIAQSSTRVATDTAWLFDPTPGVDERDAWEDVGPMNSPRAMHRAIPLPDGRVLLVGGVTAAFGLAPASVGDTVPCPEIFDPDNRTFTIIEHCPGAGLGASASIATNAHHGTFVLAGAHEAGGGEAYGFIGQGP